MLSIVVNFFNGRREARNTLYSLSRKYQDVPGDFEYEVIVIDHGSSERLDGDEVRGFGPEFVLRFVETKVVSPVRAINDACGDARGDVLLVMIDGAHILTPGVFRWADAALRLLGRALVATVPFHLGPKMQNVSITEGYSQRVEDELLARVGWKANGYRLFQATGSCADASRGWFGCLFESGCFGISKADFLAFGGFDARFESRGGGLVALDFFNRALVAPGLGYAVVLGEGTFHQLHGGVASNAPLQQHPWKEFHDEYVRIRGKAYQPVMRRPVYLGSLPAEALEATRWSAMNGPELWFGKPKGYGQ